MSQEEKLLAEEFMKNYSKLEKGDQKYIKGWVDAKADSREDEGKKKEG